MALLVVVMFVRVFWLVWLDVLGIGIGWFVVLCSGLDFGILVVVCGGYRFTLVFGYGCFVWLLFVFG